MRLVWVPFDWSAPRRLKHFSEGTTLAEAERSYRPFGLRRKLFLSVSRKKWRLIHEGEAVDRNATISVMQVPGRHTDNRELICVGFDIWDMTQHMEIPVARLLAVNKASNDTVMQQLQQQITICWNAFYAAHKDLVPNNTLFNYPARIRNQKIVPSNPCPLWNMTGFWVVRGKIVWNGSILPEESFYRKGVYSGADVLSFTTSYAPLLTAVSYCSSFSQPNFMSRMMICRMRGGHPLAVFLTKYSGFRRFLLTQIFSWALPLYT